MASLGVKGLIKKTPCTFYHKVKPRDMSEISRGGGGLETEGGSQLFETAEKGGVMKNGRLKGGGSCKYVSVIM